ncbi:helix-turn-helix domain-containing protein [Nocardia sp. CA2R105]|uniref:PucR family transcriptional regulator n=1 Tax=Nocardia coffeae TaxID=2873381 RepID=UPI001CA67546|nr:helix-turn-helix domain-containing protein [Nocardia coffeae]MBY8854968.1 helix-turn-helix domain-containing protein [Nocardia coffeae]
MSDALPSTSRRASIAMRMLDRLPRIAERILASGLGATPPAADLPDGHFREVLPAIHGCAHAFLHSVDQGREFTHDEAAQFIVPVVERHAQDRLPLRLLVEAVHASARQVLREAVALSDPDDMDQLVDFGDRMLGLLMHINAITVESYAEMEQSIHHAEREARRALCRALLRGQIPGELAVRAGIALAERYSVLAIELPRTEHPAAAAHLLTRRRIRLLQQTLDQLAGVAVLNTFDGSSGIILLPNGSADADHTSSTLARELATQFGASVVVAEIPGVARESIPGATQLATELAALARLLGRPTGAYLLDDLLLEYQLTRPGAARDRLAERVAPLLRSPHLLETLDAHLRHGSDRKAAAAEIHVHPNTFSYRLRRIAELTGTDPSEPTGSRLLSAALIVHRLYPPTEAAAS